MNSIRVAEELKEHRASLLEAVLTSDDPGYHPPLTDALLPEFLEESTDAFAQMAGNSVQGQISAAAENALLSDVRRAKQLAHETRMDRMQRVYRSRLCESEENGIIDTRINNTGARAGQDIPAGAPEE